MYFKEAMNGAYKALDKLKSEKVIKAIGVGLNESNMCARFAEAGDFDCMILAGRYTLLEQGALDVFFPFWICQPLPSLTRSTIILSPDVFE